MAKLKKNNTPVEKHEWTATGVLDASDQVMSTMPPSKLDEAKILFSSNINATLPNATDGVDWFRKGWVSMYYYPFEIGMTFPFSDLVQEVLVSLDVAAAQLMPTTWRILACLDAVERKHHLGISVDVVSYAYSSKKFNGCRYGLTTKKKDSALILNLDVVNDRKWKNF